MFHWDRGLFLTAAGLALDVPRRQKLGFISHAHSDHTAAHELSLCTPATAALFRHRRGERHRTRDMPYGKPIELGDFRLTTYPAGHCLGSAMLLAERDDESLLFTGDFKLGPSATCAEAVLPRADTLIMESTFGRPRYRLPPREETIAELIELVKTILAAGAAPVVHAYALGKSQEVSKILSDAGIFVQQHPTIFAVTEVYRDCGVEFNNVSCYAGNWQPGSAVVTLPRGMKSFRLAGLPHVVSIAVTGWAADPSTKYRQRVDHALPLSDHADFDQLLETAERVAAKNIYCTHGPREAVEHLRAAGFNAHPVTGTYQTRMF
jgi:Cft2 family RNA processing exonuclease